MKLRDWSLRRWALVIALIIVLPLVGLRLHLKWRVHRAVAAWQEAGHPVTREDILDRQARRTHANNAFPLLTKAYPLLVAPWETERPLIPMAGGYSNELLEKHGWLEPIRQATSVYLRRQQAALDLAALASERSEYWEPLDQGFNQQVKLLQLANLISLRARFELHCGSPNEAVRWLVIQCRLGGLLAGDGSYFGTDMGGAALQRAMSDLADLLGSQRANAAELRRLRDAIRPAILNWQLDAAAENEIVGGLNVVYHRIHRIPVRNPELWWQERSALEKRFDDALILLYRMSGLADQDTLHYLGAMQQAHTAGAESLTAMAALAANWNEAMPRNRGHWFHFWSAYLLPTTGSQLSNWVGLQSGLRAADAALSVAQYRLAHEGTLPAALDELVPEFLEAVPVEPQSGKRFELIITTDGYGVGRGTPVFSVKLNGARQEPRPTN